MSLVIALLVALVVVYLVYRQLNKKTDEAFANKEEAPAVVESDTLSVEPVLAVSENLAVVVDQPKKTRKKRAPSAARGKKSVKKINSLEHEK